MRKSKHKDIKRDNGQNFSSIFPSIRVYSNALAVRIRWPQYLSFSFSISPSNEYSGLIAFGIEWFVQGTLKSFFQHHSLKASILQSSAFLTVQFSHLYMTTEKTIALTIRTFVGKLMSLLFKTLPKFLINFLPRSKHLLISQLQSPSAVILEPKTREPVTASTFSPSICHEVMGMDAVILVFLILSFKPASLLSSFTLIKGLFGSSLLSVIRVVPSG